MDSGRQHEETTQNPCRDAPDPAADQARDLLAFCRALLAQGQAGEALPLLDRLNRLAPDHPETSLLLAEALHQAGRSADALAVCRKVKEARLAGQDRADPGAWAELLAASAWTALGRGRRNEAMAMFRRALEMAPGLALSHAGLATALFEKLSYEEAAAHFAQAATLAPDAPEPLIGLSSTYVAMGRNEEALACGAAAVARAPENIEARLARCMANLRILYECPEQIEESRRDYLASLRELAGSFLPKDAAAIKAGARALGGLGPFYLAYQGLCDVEPQRIYGGFASRIAAAAWPEHARPIEPPPVEGPLRIGIVSAFFRNHSVWKTHIRDWLENLDPERFAFYCYHTGDEHDKITEYAGGICRKFVSGPSTAEEFAPLVKKDRLHALIYPEIGLHPLTFKLAALRLAPVQCTSWGHPETSGLPTIDYFLSSDLMEPEGAETHYTERLVRLPNLSTSYRPPDVPFVSAGREAFGLPEGEVLYFCAQSLFKYLPQYDDVFPRIAREVGNCRFVFIGSQGSPRITERFKNRLGRAFARFGLDPDRHMLLVGRLALPQYHALVRCCDVFLDSFGWSGCNTTLEALAWGLPVVTLPGGLMRGRHSLAILAMTGEKRTVVGSVEEYVRMAVRLGRDREFREEARARVLASRERAYGDTACVRAMEAFLVSVAGRAGAAGSREDGSP